MNIVSHCHCDPSVSFHPTSSVFVVILCGTVLNPQTQVSKTSALPSYILSLSFSTLRSLTIRGSDEP